MCIINKQQSTTSKMFNRSELSRALQATLTVAKANRRLICGLLTVIAHLDKSSEDVLFCLLSETRPGDAGAHMQMVLLQAFCYENFIPVIQVNSSEKLAEYCGMPNAFNQSGCTCAIVTRDLSLPSTPEVDIPMSPTEQMLANFYEFTLKTSQMTTIELPS